MQVNSSLYKIDNNYTLFSFIKSKWNTVNWIWVVRKLATLKVRLGYVKATLLLPGRIAAGDLGNLNLPSSDGWGGGAESEGEGGSVGSHVAEVDINCGKT